jgi:DNA-directed RNA polymerase subunit L
MTEMVDLKCVLKILTKYIERNPDVSMLLYDINHEILKLPRTSLDAETERMVSEDA